MSNSESVGDQRRILEISEEVAREKLVEVFELSGSVRHLIAVDLDDVLCQTTKCVAECASLLVIPGCSACNSPLTAGAAQGIIAGLEPTCKLNTFIVSTFPLPSLWSSRPYPQASLTDGHRPDLV
jgi:hypothetical protein